MDTVLHTELSGFETRLYEVIFLVWEETPEGQVTGFLPPMQKTSAEFLSPSFGLWDLESDLDYRISSLFLSRNNNNKKTQ